MGAVEGLQFFKLKNEDRQTGSVAAPGFGRRKWDMCFVRVLNRLSIRDRGVAGGKGASLGEMMRAGICVPPGFVVTSRAMSLSRDQAMPMQVRKAILAAFTRLKTRRVAVRSSALVEDGASSSWAGQLESYLNVTRGGLIEAIMRCWSALGSPSVLQYGMARKEGVTGDGMAVVVQRMVDSDVSGVMFTVNPVTMCTSEVVVEAILGLGELLVQGDVTPDSYVVRKGDLRIAKRVINVQESKLVVRGGRSTVVRLPSRVGRRSAISDDQVSQLARVGLEIEQHYGFPQDIEWAIEGGKIYVLQARPLTTL